jgi:hypothetical protein
MERARFGATRYRSAKNLLDTTRCIRKMTAGSSWIVGHSTLLATRERRCGAPRSALAPSRPCGRSPTATLAAVALGQDDVDGRGARRITIACCARMRWPAYELQGSYRAIRIAERDEEFVAPVLPWRNRALRPGEPTCARGAHRSLRIGGRRLSGSTVGDDFCIVACLDAPPILTLTCAVTQLFPSRFSRRGLPSAPGKLGG